MHSFFLPGVLKCILNSLAPAIFHQWLITLKMFVDSLLNQMLAKVHIIIVIEKQIMSLLENCFPFVDSTSQTRDMEKKKFGPISVLMPYYFCVLLFANKCCIVSFLPFGLSSARMDFLRVAHYIRSFMCPRSTTTFTS